MGNKKLVEGTTASSNNKNGRKRKKGGKEGDECYPLSTIVGSLMFSYGDSERPLEASIQFVLEVVNYQLKMLVKKAEKLTLERGKQSIGYLEVVFAFRRHQTLVRRLVIYLRTIDMIRLYSVCESQSTSMDETHEMVAQNSLLSSNPSELNSKSSAADFVVNALREIDILGHLLAGFPDWVDNTKKERLHRIGIRTKEMDAEEYKKLAEARQMSFCNNKGKKSDQFCKCFMDWLGSPLVESEAEDVVYLFNFCASEIVAILVESALICRQEQQRRWQPESCMDDRPAANPLELGHYQEAVRRNRGYAKRGDILFGNF